MPLMADIGPGVCRSKGLWAFSLEEDLRVRLAIRDVVPRDHVREDAIEEVRVA